MASSSLKCGLELICIIVNNGLGSKVVHRAKACGIRGGTVFLGKGTVKNPVLDFLELNDVRKEIVWLVSSIAEAECAMKKLNREFEFEKPNQGIAFTISVTKIAGTRGYGFEGMTGERGEGETMYTAITVIVDKGKAEEVIEAAEKAGSTGGTIINARGSGVHETSRIFLMDIEPEKEIVLLISKKEKTDEIIAFIMGKLKMEEPGNGIIFTQEINEVYGLYE